MLLLLMACNMLGPQGERYYSGGGPEVTAVGSGEASEPGNLGGYEVSITGSGFGEDADLLVVTFGTQNAEVLSATDSELLVVTPVGPVTGGLVDVRVANRQGVGRLENAYEYDVGDLYEGQVGFISINDYTQSYSSYNISSSGTAGAAQLYGFEFRRVHSTDYGVFGGTDWTGNEWVIETPAYPGYLAATQDLTLEFPANPSVVDIDADGDPIGDQVCVNLNALGRWYDASAGEFVYPEDTTKAPDSACEDEKEGYRWVDSSKLEFCERIEFEEDTNDYQAAYPYESPWAAPVGEEPGLKDRQKRIDSCHDGIDNDGDGDFDESDADCLVRVRVDADQSGLDELELTLPLAIQVEVSQGIVGDTAFGEFGLTQLGACPDGEKAMELRWWPSELDLEKVVESDDKIVDAGTHIRVSMTMLSFGWFGGEGFVQQATLTLDDEESLIDEETGQVVLTVPRDVLLSFPTIDYSPLFGSAGCQTDQFSGKTTCPWGDPALNDYGYMFLTVDRVTEYRLHTENRNVDGDIILSYTSGDLTLLYNAAVGGFPLFESPLENGPCDDCTDNDGDGWVDGDDADCVDGEAEDGAFDAQYSCSDGIDNDGNGLIDAEDTENCESGTDGETNCFNGVDDDEDGWTDELDGECVNGGADGQESGADSAGWLCTNGLDDDGDGWFDAEDPDCLDGSYDEVGFGTTACNDGVDNDGHYDIDAADPLCASRGASFDWEAPAASAEVAGDGEPYFQGECVNGTDDDGTNPLDGYIDNMDPDCERPPNYWQETRRTASPSDPDYTECYDGIDNDGDGLKDAADPGCWNVNADFGWAAVPDGFLDDESDDGDCTDGVDNDNDGATDLDDAGCTPGVAKDEASAD